MYLYISKDCLIMKIYIYIILILLNTIYLLIYTYNIYYNFYIIIYYIFLLAAFRTTLQVLHSLGTYRGVASMGQWGQSPPPPIEVLAPQLEKSLCCTVYCP